MRAITAFAVAASVALVLTPTWAQEENQGPIIEDMNLGAVVHTTRIPLRENFRVVTVLGAPAEESKNWTQAQKLVWAAEEARQLGLLALAYALGDVYLTTNTTIRKGRKENREIETAVTQVVRYAREVKWKGRDVDWTDSNGITHDGHGVELTMEVPLYGPSSIVSAFQSILRQETEDEVAQFRRIELPEPETAAPLMPAAAQEIFTGLVVDARGRGVGQGMAPKILTGTRRLVYAIGDTDGDYAERFGIVSYGKTGDEPWLAEVVGHNPVEATASGIEGQIDVVISDDDGVRIAEADRTDRFLKECRVVFLVD